MLREFWFPTFLALGGTVSGMVGLFAEDYARRWCWTLTFFLWFLGGLSYIWGDPVRGPFSRLIHPNAEEKFTLHAGFSMKFPIKQLREGIDFGNVIKIPKQPLNLFVRRNWWSGWDCSLSILIGDERVVLMEHNKISSQVPSGWDVNFDDHSIEVMNADNLPVLQVIQDGDYDIYVNAVLLTDTGGAMIMKGSRFEQKPKNRVTRTDFPTVLFKYPSYANRGVRQ